MEIPGKSHENPMEIPGKSHENPMENPRKIPWKPGFFGTLLQSTASGERADKADTTLPAGMQRLKPRPGRWVL